VLVAEIYDMWYFDEKLGSVILLKNPTTSPHWTLMVYRLSRRAYRVLYTNRFLGIFSGLCPLLNYRHFLGFFHMPKKARMQCFLYDAAANTFPGSLVIPIKDSCNMIGVGYDVIIGTKEKVLISCKIRGQIKATIYDIERLNKSKSFNLVLKNGVKVYLLITGTILQINVDIYHIGIIYRSCFIFAYRKENMFKPVKCLIKRMNKSWHYRLLFNRWLGMIFVLRFPGLEAVAMKMVYDPSEGLLTNGSGKMTFRESRSYFYPTSKDPHEKHFRFNPRDGAFMHLQRPRGKPVENEYLTSVDKYKFVE
jgi:hypothetical protein